MSSCRRPTRTPPPPGLSGNRSTRRRAVQRRRAWRGLLKAFTDLEAGHDYLGTTAHLAVETATSIEANVGTGVGPVQAQQAADEGPGPDAPPDPCATAAHLAEAPTPGTDAAVVPIAGLAGEHCKAEGENKGAFLNDQTGNDEIYGDPEKDEVRIGDLNGFFEHGVASAPLEREGLDLMQVERDGGVPFALRTTSCRTRWRSASRASSGRARWRSVGCPTTSRGRRKCSASRATIEPPELFQRFVMGKMGETDSEEGTSDEERDAMSRETVVWDVWGEGDEEFEWTLPTTGLPARWRALLGSGRSVQWNTIPRNSLCGFWIHWTETWLTNA